MDVWKHTTLLLSFLLFPPYRILFGKLGDLLQIDLSRFRFHTGFMTFGLEGATVITLMPSLEFGREVVLRIIIAESI